MASRPASAAGAPPPESESASVAVESEAIPESPLESEGWRARSCGHPSGPRASSASPLRDATNVASERRPRPPARARRTEAEMLAPFAWDARAATHPAGEALAVPDSGKRARRPVRRLDAGERRVRPRLRDDEEEEEEEEDDDDDEEDEDDDDYDGSGGVSETPEAFSAGGVDAVAESPDDVEGVGGAGIMARIIRRRRTAPADAPGASDADPAAAGDDDDAETARRRRRSDASPGRSRAHPPRWGALPTSSDEDDEDEDDDDERRRPRSSSADVSRGTSSASPPRPPPDRADRPPPRGFPAADTETDDETEAEGTARFEVEDADDAAVSEHSDGSQERTAGARGFKPTELAGDAYGKGRRLARARSGVAGDRTDVAALLARRRPAWDTQEEEEEEEEEGSREASPFPPPFFVRPVPAETKRPSASAEEGGARAGRGASSSRRAGAAAKQTRLDRAMFLPAAAAADAAAVPAVPAVSAVPAVPAAASSRAPVPAAPWNFSETLDPFAPRAGEGADVAASFAAAAAARGEPSAERSRSTAAEGERALRVAARLHRAGASAGRAGATRAAAMSPSDRAEWRRALETLERNERGSFWTAMADVIAETRREVAEEEEEEEENGEEGEGGDEAAREVSEASPSAAATRARRNEPAWELLFVAAGAWRASGRERSSGEEEERSSGGASDAGASDAWSARAWSVVSDVLAASPLPPPPERAVDGRVRPASSGPACSDAFDPRAYAAAVARRVAALARRWPRCASRDGPAWEVFRRVVGVGEAGGGVGFAAAERAADPAAAFARSDPPGPRTPPDPPRLDCCAIPPPPRHPAASPSLAVPALVPARRCACAAALAALAAHLGAAAGDAKAFRRDLGRLLSAASLLRPPPFEAPGEARTTPTPKNPNSKTPNPNLGFRPLRRGSSFLAVGGARFAASPLGSWTRHRAATHAALFAGCLSAGAVDQAALCLKQLRAALDAGRLPDASDDPVPRATVCRAIGVAADAWRAHAAEDRTTAAGATRRGGGDDDGGADAAAAKMKLAARDALSREGEAAMDALAREAAREPAPPPGTVAERRVAAAAAEAAEAAARTWAAYAAANAPDARAVVVAAQTRFCFRLGGDGGGGGEDETGGTRGAVGRCARGTVGRRARGAVGRRALGALPPHPTRTWK